MKLTPKEAAIEMCKHPETFFPRGTVESVTPGRGSSPNYFQIKLKDKQEVSVVPYVDRVTENFTVVIDNDNDHHKVRWFENPLQLGYQIAQVVLKEAPEGGDGLSSDQQKQRQIVFVTLKRDRLKSNPYPVNTTGKSEGPWEIHFRTHKTTLEWTKRGGFKAPRILKELDTTTFSSRREAEQEIVQIVKKYKDDARSHLMFLPGTGKLASAHVAALYMQEQAGT